MVLHFTVVLRVALHREVIYENQMVNCKFIILNVTGRQRAANANYGTSWSGHTVATRLNGPVALQWAKVDNRVELARVMRSGASVQRPLLQLSQLIWRNKSNSPNGVQPDMEATRLGPLSLAIRESICVHLQ